MLLSWLSLSPIFWFALFTAAALPLTIGGSRIGDWLHGGLFAAILVTVAVTGGSLLVTRGTSSGRRITASIIIRTDRTPAP